jgi:glycosyltransferase involved in cell wall biosynthesis
MTLQQSSQKTISLVLPALIPPAGAERVQLTLAEEFRKQGYNIDLVLCNEPNNIPDEIKAIVRPVNLGVSRTRRVLQPLRDYLRNVQPAGVIASLWPLTTLSIVALKLSGVQSRIMVCDHAVLSHQYSSWSATTRLALRASIRVTYGFADSRVGVSQTVVTDLAQLSGLKRDRFTVIHNPIKIEAPDDDALSWAEAQWQGCSGKRVLAVGKLKPEKNHHLLIRAFERVLLTHDACLVIAGAGECEHDLRGLIAERGLEGRVRLVGWVENPAALYRSADLFAMSSDAEGFGNVIVEALGNGLPVVSTDCPGGPAEILQNGRLGRLCPVGDETALADAISDALQEAQTDRSALIARANDFRPDVIADRYLAELFG